MRFAFLTSDSGAVTVDWVTLTAGVVGLGLASVGAVATGNSALGEQIRTALSQATVAGANRLGASGFDPAGLIWWNAYDDIGHWHGTPGQIGGWVLGDPTMRVDVMPANFYPWLRSGMPGGGTVLDLTGRVGENLDIRQSIDAAAGTPLTVSFRLGTENPSGVRVWFGDTLLHDFTSVPTRSLESYSFAVTAGDPSQNYLRFETTYSTGWNGAMLTDVVVQ